MKKIFKTGLAAACVAAMLVGCGQQSDTNVAKHWQEPGLQRQKVSLKIQQIKKYTKERL